MESALIVLASTILAAAAIYRMQRIPAVNTEFPAWVIPVFWAGIAVLLGLVPIIWLLDF